MHAKPDMATFQAMVAYQDVIYRFLYLHDIAVRQELHGDNVDVSFTIEGTPYSCLFPGMEGLACSYQKGFDQITRWLEGIEADQIGGLDAVEIVNALENKELKPEAELAFMRTISRWQENEWLDLDKAYLHRIFMWPSTPSEVNRHERRKAAKLQVVK